MKSMKVKYELPFHQVNLGKQFEYNGGIYVRMSAIFTEQNKYNAVNLLTGYPEEIGDNELVLLTPVTIYEDDGK